MFGFPSLERFAHCSTRTKTKAYGEQLLLEGSSFYKIDQDFQIHSQQRHFLQVCLLRESMVRIAPIFMILLIARIGVTIHGFKSEFVMPYMVTCCLVFPKKALRDSLIFTWNTTSSYHIRGIHENVGYFSVGRLVSPLRPIVVFCRNFEWVALCIKHEAVLCGCDSSLFIHLPSLPFLPSLP